MLAAVAGFAAAHAAEPAPARVVYAGATLVDGTGAEPVRDTVVVVEGERIVHVGPTRGYVTPRDADIVDVRGLTVLPGLVDAHVHLATPPDRPRALARLRRDLHGGVTTVRSMGDDVRAVADLARAARSGEIAAPDIHYAALFAGPGFFHDPRVVAAAAGEVAGETPWLREIGPRTDLAEAITLARGAGASGIKIYGNLDAGAVARIVREAHRQGLPAWAHGGVFPASPSQVVAAGADTLSHVCMLAYEAQAMPGAYHDRADVDESKFAEGMPRAVESLYAAMKARGTVLDATNYVYETIERMRKDLPEGEGPPSYCSSGLAERLTAAAHAAGVDVAAGTDAPSPDDDAWPSLQRELEIFVTRAGMTPLAAIRAATLVGARALGREAEIGTIAPGKLANLVFVAGDAARDIGALRRVRLVVKRGVQYRREDFATAAHARAD